MSRRFAEGTTVPVDRSRAEVERVLRAKGATRITVGYEVGAAAVVQFSFRGRLIRYELNLGATQAPTPRRRSSRADLDHEREERRLWRALVLALRAKFAVVESGITSAEDEFLAQTVVRTGDGVVGTVGALIRPGIDESYERGEMPSSILALGQRAGPSVP